MPKLENFLIEPQSQNYNSNCLTFLNKDLQFKERLDEFSVEILEKFRLPGLICKHF